MGTGWLVCSSFNDVRIRPPDPQNLSDRVCLRCQPDHAPAVFTGNVPLAALWPVYSGSHSDRLQYDLLSHPDGGHRDVYEVQKIWCQPSVASTRCNHFLSVFFPLTHLIFDPLLQPLQRGFCAQAVVTGRSVFGIAASQKVHHSVGHIKGPQILQMLQ